MPRSPITQVEFDELTKALALEFQSAVIDFQMYEDLAEAADAHPVVVAQSRAFWDMSIQSHLNSAILRLCRVYDQQVSSMNFAKWLRLIKGNPNWFKGNKPDPTELDKDIEFASNTNPQVQNLTKFRGTVVAHLGENYVLNVRNTRESFTLTFGDVKELLQKGFRTFNRYSTIYNGQEWSPNLVGAKDYEFIFHELEKAIERIRAEQLEGFEKHRGVKPDSGRSPDHKP